MKNIKYSDDLENKIKNTLSNLSAEQEAKVFDRNIDLDVTLDKKTTDRIKKKVYERLEITTTAKACKKKNLGRTVLYAAAILAVLALSVTAICAKDTPLKDRIIKMFSDESAETKTSAESTSETERVYPYESSPVLPAEKYRVAESVDFSGLSFTDVDEIVVTSGLNGDVMTFTDTGELISQIKKITCHSPVSSRGYYGYYYHIRIRSNNKELYNFAVTLYGDKYYVFYDTYEKIGNFEYPALYVANDEVKDLTDFLKSGFEKSGN